MTYSIVARAAAEPLLLAAFERYEQLGLLPPGIVGRIPRR